MLKKRGTRGARVPRLPGRTALLRGSSALALAAFFAAASTAQPLTPVAPPAPVDSLAAADTAAADSIPAVVTRADTAQVVMHHFNHRQQIIAGGSIMATLIVVMTVMNNYNPRVPPR